MQIKKTKPTAPTIKACQVSVGQVYTCGVGEQFYLSTNLGAVNLNSGTVLNASDERHRPHFQQEVRVVKCVLQVEE